MECAVPVYEECQELEAEKIEHQRTIIELQEEVIKKKEEELEAVKESIKSSVKNQELRFCGDENLCSSSSAKEINCSNKNSSRK